LNFGEAALEQLEADYEDEDAARYPKRRQRQAEKLEYEFPREAEGSDDDEGRYDGPPRDYPFLRLAEVFHEADEYRRVGDGVHYGEEAEEHLRNEYG